MFSTKRKKNDILKVDVTLMKVYLDYIGNLRSRPFKMYFIIIHPLLLLSFRTLIYLLYLIILPKIISSLYSILVIRISQLYRERMFKLMRYSNKDVIVS